MNTESIHRHLANIRSSIGAHNSMKMLYILYQRQGLSIEHLKLNPRGKEVFLLTIKGDSDVEIGDQLQMSYNGVRKHKEKMILANDCSSMQELVGRYYMQS